MTYSMTKEKVTIKKPKTKIPTCYLKDYLHGTPEVKVVIKTNKVSLGIKLYMYNHITLVLIQHNQNPRKQLAVGS